MIRLQVFIARAGIASRRSAEQLIKEGRVKVNGKTITELGFKVAEGDSVKVNDKRIIPEKKVYLVLNKPEGCLSAVSDDRGRKTVIDIIKMKERIFPVGRLDYNTTGCLILTNDGDWANAIMHPKFRVEKKYTAKIKGRIGASALNRLKRGVKIDGKRVKPVRAGVNKRNENNDSVYVIITEGMNHQVKKMLAMVGCSVVWLKRESVGKIAVHNIPKGKWRFLTKPEIDSFK